MRLYDPKGLATPAEIVAALTSDTRKITFRFERLSSTNQVIGDLDGVLSCSVSNNQFADIKRTAKMQIRDSTTVNYLSDRIRPYVVLETPLSVNADTVEWPQGVFLLSTPSRVLQDGAIALRDVDCYDQLLVLRDDKVADRYAVTATTVYTTAITTLIGTLCPSVSITPSTLALAATMEWEPGTSRLKILNDLLSGINYASAWFDENGTLICAPYVSPSNAASEYTYVTDTRSVITGDVSQTLDLFSVPNKWVLTVSTPDRAVLTSTYTNTSPSSPTSTVNRGRTIVDVRTENDAADQTTLDAKVARLAFEASQVYEIIEFTTSLMPVHSNADTYTVDVDGLVSAKYNEHEWSMDLSVGGKQKHKVRRVVGV